MNKKPFQSIGRDSLDHRRDETMDWIVAQIVMQPSNWEIINSN
jgi:hypothetical protein